MIKKNDTGLYEATVDGRVYEWEKWGAEEAMDTLMDLVAVLGKPLTSLGAKAFSKGVAEALRVEVGEDAIESILSNLVDNLTGNRPLVMKVIKRLTAHPKMFCDGKKIDFDAHYSGELATAWKVAAAALEVQYGNFFAAASALTGIRRGAALKADTPK